MAGASEVPAASTQATLEDILNAQKAAQKVFVDDRIRGYTVDIVTATRNPSAYQCAELSHLIDNGASVRASINLIKLSKAQALLDGRDYVSPHDIKTLAKDVLRHRIALSYEAEAQGKTADDIIAHILDRIEVYIIGGPCARVDATGSPLADSHPKTSIRCVLAGAYLSVFKGSGVEFDEVRPYVPKMMFAVLTGTSRREQVCHTSNGLSRSVNCR